MYAGVLVLADTLRKEAASFIADLRSLGVRRVVLATGDVGDVAYSVSKDLPVEKIYSELMPNEKVDVVRAEQPNGLVLMMGDGVNDAPALAAADVGVAMGATGAAAAAQAADVVLFVDRLQQLVLAMRIAKRTKQIALQSVYVGIGLSMVGMMVAAVGYLSPVQGALAQEAIDVLVIVDALRALSD